MTRPVAYVNDDGDVWIERGAAPWPAILREARAMLDEIDEPTHPMRYLGLVRDVRVSDEDEYVHGDDDACRDSASYGDYGSLPEGWTPCCRTVDAHHFRCVER